MSLVKRIETRKKSLENCLKRFRKDIEDHNEKMSQCIYTAGRIAILEEVLGMIERDKGEGND